MMSKWLLLLVVVGVMVWTGECQNCATYSDGCSAWGIIPYKRTFKPACDRHDVCYGCGAMYGHSRRDCDDAFLRDMTVICGTRSGKRKRSVADLEDGKKLEKRSSRTLTCQWWAEQYVNAVRGFGRRYYRNLGNTEDHCNQRWWVPECLP